MCSGRPGGEIHIGSLKGFPEDFYSTHWEIWITLWLCTRIRKATIQTQHMSNIKELLKKKWPDEQETEKAVDLLETFIVHLQQDCFTPDLCFPISPSCDAGLSFHI